jgi:hypothetical protein
MMNTPLEASFGFELIEYPDTIDLRAFLGEALKKLRSVRTRCTTPGLPFRDLLVVVEPEPLNFDRIKDSLFGGCLADPG